jgi:hypothetical protein
VPPGGHCSQLWTVDARGCMHSYMIRSQGQEAVETRLKVACSFYMHMLAAV